MSEEARAIQAERIGGHAWQYLTTQSRKGRVVSSFSGGINLLFEDGEAFVPVQTSAVPLHPWAIEIAGRVLLFAEKTPVSAEARDLLVGNTRIVLSTARIEELSLPRLSAEGVAIAQRNLPILARLVNEARKTHPPDPFQQQIDAILARWRKTEDPEVLLDLIGLGAGSTPSGDDVLVGILAGLSIFGGRSSRSDKVLAHLRAGISDNARGRTPLPSAQMLLAACSDAFPELVVELSSALLQPGVSGEMIEELVKRISQIGHHSGIAMLSGLIEAFSQRYS